MDCHTQLDELTEEIIAEHGPDWVMADLSTNQRAEWDQLTEECQYADDEWNYDYDGQPDWAQEWHDFDPDC